MENNTLMAIVVIGLLAVISLQTVQIFGMQPRTETRSTGMASGNAMNNNMMGQAEQFNSVEEMMAAHHGSGAGGCGGH